MAIENWDLLFWEKVKVDPGTGCWNYFGPCRVHTEIGLQGAPHVAWRLAGRSPAPALRKTCGNILCISPEHRKQMPWTKPAAVRKKVHVRGPGLSRDAVREIMAGKPGKLRLVARSLGISLGYVYTVRSGIFLSRRMTRLRNRALTGLLRRVHRRPDSHRAQ